MHPHISAFPSKTFYSSRLLDGPDLSSIRKQPWHSKLPFSPYTFLDIEGGTEVSSLKSWINPTEALAAAELYLALRVRFPTSATFKYSIGIITPYKAQQAELCRVFGDRFGKDVSNAVTINTVDVGVLPS